MYNPTKTKRDSHAAHTTIEVVSMERVFAVTVLLVHYGFTSYQYHRPLVSLSGAESTQLDIGLRPGT